MFDYLFAAPDETTARQDPTLGARWLAATGFSPAEWDTSVVNPGARVWNEAQDVTKTITDPQMGQVVITTHTYLPGFWATVSTRQRDAALEASPYLVLGADRDLADQGATRDVFVVALGPGQTLSAFTGMHVEPLMAGSAYPFG